MPDSCAAYGCCNRRTSGSNLRFFTFPKDAILRKRWIVALKRKNFVPKDKSTKICSEHFVDSDYLVRPNINFPPLKPDAVPSVFKGFPDHLQPKPKKPRSSSVLNVLRKRNKVQENVPSTTSNLPSVPDKSTNSACDLPEDEVPVSLGDGIKLRSKEVQTEITAAQDSTFSIPSTSNVRENLPENDIESRSKRIQTTISTLRDNIFHTLESKVSAQVRKIRTLQQKIRRQRRKINNLTALLSTLKSEGFLETEGVEILSEQFGAGITRDIFQNEIKNAAKLPKGRRYSDEVKKFALTLHYHSPKAYEYCREIFKLPHASSLTKWLGSVNAEPGFFTKVFDAVKNFPESERDINLVLDGMAIKKNLQWDTKSQSFLGYCDFGEEIFLDRPDTEATEALVFMIVSLRGQWKWPIGTYEYLIFIVIIYYISFAGFYTLHEVR